MKKFIAVSIVGWLFGSLFSGYSAQAQVTTPSADQKKETQEIIIRKNGEKDAKLTVEFTGDKVIINGKPLAEFNEDGLTINNRKIIVRKGDAFVMDFGDKQIQFNRDMKAFEKKMKAFDEERLKAGPGRMEFFNDDSDGEENSTSSTYTFLGVATNQNAEGAEINSVVKNSPAEKAGLQKSDIIYKIDNQKITDPQGLSTYIQSKKKDDNVKVYFIREGKKKDIKVTLGQQTKVVKSVRIFSLTNPDGSVKTLTIPQPPMPPGPPRFDKNWGDQFGENIFEPRRPKLGLKIQDMEDGNGVKILEVEENSASATAGLLKDDVITEIGNVKVSKTDDAIEQLQMNREKASYSLKAKRNGNEMTFNIKVPKKLKTANL